MSRQKERARRKCCYYDVIPHLVAQKAKVIANIVSIGRARFCLCKLWGRRQMRRNAATDGRKKARNGWTKPIFNSQDTLFSIFHSMR